MLRAVVLFLCMGCTVPPTPGTTDTSLNRPDTPTIDTFDLFCDTSLERWQLDVRTLGWTGGGEWWWTVDGEYVEKHDVSSRKAARDGSWDELRLRLDIVADWRDAVRNSSTPFLCASNPTGRLFLRDLDGTIVTCVDTGTDTEWLTTYNNWPECP